MSNEQIGSSFDSYLDEDGIREEVESLAQKRVFAWKVRQAMDEHGVSKSDLAERMGTSRSQVDRLLDPENSSVQLDTLVRAAHAVGRTLKLELI